MGGTLEVLLVGAEGFKHTNLIGKPTYYVVFECGNEVHKSKTSKAPLFCGQVEIFWNEKFAFELPRTEMDNEIYLKLKIMNQEIFSHGGFVGGTTIYLKGIIIEGKDKGSIEVKPAPYNVVLDDDTFQGQIELGLRYIHDKTEETESRKRLPEENEEKKEPTGHSTRRSVVKFWHITWWRFLFSFKSRKSSKSNDKQKLN